MNNRVRKVVADGTITTVAGTGVAGFSGDGGPATAARLNEPFRVALDQAGNLYISDFGNFRVRKVALDGTITTFAGNGNASSSGDGGPAVSASVDSPGDLVMDSAGNLFIASGAFVGDGSADVIRKVTPAGVIATVAGNGNAGYSGDGGPATSAVPCTHRKGLAIALQCRRPVHRRPVQSANSQSLRWNNHDCRGHWFGWLRRRWRPCRECRTVRSGRYVIRCRRQPVHRGSRQQSHSCITDQWKRISTVAGTGDAAFTGDGVAAAGAALSSPCEAWRCGVEPSTWQTRGTKESAC